MAIQTRYITLDEFAEYFVDTDLRTQLGTDESALAFMRRIEDRMETFLAVNFHQYIDREFARFTDYQKRHYKRALLEQAIYIFRNGDITVDSGYDLDRGVIADINTLNKIAIAPNAKQELMLCGLWDRNLNGARGSEVWWIW